MNASAKYYNIYLDKSARRSSSIASKKNASKPWKKSAARYLRYRSSRAFYLSFKYSMKSYLRYMWVFMYKVFMYFFKSILSYLKMVLMFICSAFHIISLYMYLLMLKFNLAVYLIINYIFYPIYFIIFNNWNKLVVEFNYYYYNYYYIYKDEFWMCLTFFTMIMYFLFVKLTMVNFIFYILLVKFMSYLYMKWHLYLLQFMYSFEFYKNNNWSLSFKKFLILIIILFFSSFMMFFGFKLLYFLLCFLISSYDIFCDIFFD